MKIKLWGGGGGEVAYESQRGKSIGQSEVSLLKYQSLSFRLQRPQKNCTRDSCGMTKNIRPENTFGRS